MEQWVRKLEPFRQFLEVAAQMNGKIINFSKIGREAGIDDKTAERFYEILNETLIGFFLPAYQTSVRKRFTQASKFYFFDTGVVRALNGQLGTSLIPQTFAYGDTIEHWVILELGN